MINIIYHREMQIKITMRYYYTSTRTATIQKTDNANFWLGYGATGILFCYMGIQKGNSHFGRSFGDFAQS